MDTVCTCMPGVIHCRRLRFLLLSVVSLIICATSVGCYCFPSFVDSEIKREENRKAKVKNNSPVYEGTRLFSVSNIIRNTRYYMIVWILLYKNTDLYCKKKQKKNTQPKHLPLLAQTKLHTDCTKQSLTNSSPTACPPFQPLVTDFYGGQKTGCVLFYYYFVIVAVFVITTDSLPHPRPRTNCLVNLAVPCVSDAESDLQGAHLKCIPPSRHTHQFQAPRGSGWLSFAIYVLSGWQKKSTIYSYNAQK